MFMKTYVSTSLRLLITANFWLASLMLLISGIVSVSDNYTLFEFNQEIYGELANSLRIMMLYLALTELGILLLCIMLNAFQYYLLAGLFVLLLIPGLEFFSAVNNVVIDPNLALFFLYVGCSHLLFGALMRFQTA